MKATHPFTDIALRLAEWLDSQQYTPSDKKPTIVLAFDNYGDMELAWRTMMRDFQAFMVPPDFIRLREVNNFTVAGLQFQFRVKLNKEIA